MSTETELKLLTLLNVSAIKRPRDMDIPGGHRGSSSQSGSRAASPAVPLVQPKKRKSVVFGGELGPSGSAFGKKAKNAENGTVVKGKGKGKEINLNGNGNGHAEEREANDNESNGLVGIEEDGGSDDETNTLSDDHFNVHFATAPDILTDGSIASVADNQWTTEKTALKGFGKSVQLRPTGSTSQTAEVKTRLAPALAEALRKSNPAPLVSTSLSHLGSYRDIYLHSLDGEADGSEKTLYGDKKEAMRKAVTVHSLNHVLKTRRKIIRNNEKLAHAAADASTPAVDPPRDQSFTRPKVLILLPVRSLALHYLVSHLFPLAPADTQIENLKPFISSFSIPSGMEDPLASSSAVSDYPIDHLVNFKGNSDDNFRFGIKITRKAWRVVMMPANEAKLMECDILIASPLGIKMQSEKEDSTDLLSSIEIAVADGLDVMQMQNWDHVQYVFSHLNKIPKSPHGCDFSRVKPWYLDQQAQYLRQTVLMSRYDTPEARSLFHRQCFNLEGKIRLENNDHPGILSTIRPGIKQVFERVDLAAPGPKGLSGDAAVDEVEQRFKHFVTNTVPALQRSAISRQNTLIVVPSYFDFVLLTDHFRKDDKISYASISEYSSNSEISRARTMFFKGKKSFLVVTERFHFYRRYKLRGAKTIVFYALPEHAQFYREFMETPFLPGRNGDGDEVEVDVEEVSSRVLISRFDALKLERVIGSQDARQILSRGDDRFVYA